ncbi:MAG TPA: hypothetical protein VGC30_13310, partial [Dokdonella sp.]
MDGITGIGALVGDFSSGDYDDAEGADDFVVTGDDGWTVTGFDFVAFADDGGAPPPTGIVKVFAANIDRPGTDALCSATDVPLAYDAASASVRAILPTACALPPGHYFVDFAFITSRTDPLGYWGETRELHGLP